MTDCNPDLGGDRDRSPHENEANDDSPARPPVEVFRSSYDEDESPSAAVVSAVSAMEGVEPTEVESLHDRIDPDALDTLLDRPVVIGDGGPFGVEFQYAGYRVIVRNNGSITILEDTK
jgi:hypothetical protein